MFPILFESSPSRLGTGYILLLAAWLCGLSFTESIAETTTYQFQVTSTTSSGGLPALSLDGPVVAADFGSWIPALGAC